MMWSIYFLCCRKITNKSERGTLTAKHFVHENLLKNLRVKGHGKQKKCLRNFQVPTKWQKIAVEKSGLLIWSLVCHFSLLLIFLNLKNISSLWISLIFISMAITGPVILGYELLLLVGRNNIIFYYHDVINLFPVL